MNVTANSFATTVNPAARGNGAAGATTPMMMMMATTTGCPCAPSQQHSSNVGVPTSAYGTSVTANTDDSQANNVETLLSSNAKFQAISAIAVSQDGVINVADQGN